MTMMMRIMGTPIVRMPVTVRVTTGPSRPRNGRWCIKRRIRIRRRPNSRISTSWNRVSSRASGVRPIRRVFCVLPPFPSWVSTRRGEVFTCCASRSRASPTSVRFRHCWAGRVFVTIRCPLEWCRSAGVLASSTTTAAEWSGSSLRKHARCAMPARRQSSR